MDSTHGCKRCCGRSPLPVIGSSLPINCATGSKYCFGMARGYGFVPTCTLQTARLSKVAKVFYLYHPLFGKELEVFGGAGGQRDLIYVKLPNNTTRGIPAWMFDEVVCSGVRTAEQPVIDCGALLRLAQLLDSLEASPRTGDNENNSHPQTEPASTAAPTAADAALGNGGAKPTPPGEQSHQVRAVVPPTVGECRSPKSSKARRPR